MWTVALIVGGIVGAYLVYVLLVVLRLRAVARWLARELEPRGFTVESHLSTLDLEDPYCLSVELRRNGHTFSFPVFRALTTIWPSWEFVRIEIEPLLLLREAGAALHLHFDAKDDPITTIGSIYLAAGKAETLTLDVEDLDARYLVIEEKSQRNSPEALSLVRATFAHPDVRALLLEFGGHVALKYGALTLAPARGDASFIDGIERAARLADALDAAVKGGAVYR
jgi:hypothetical protein